VTIVADDVAFVDTYLPYLLARASHLISGEFHREVEAAGLSVPEWRVLATLHDRPHCTVGTLADIVLTKQPTLTKLIDRMAAEGLVEKRSGESDRRHALVSITALGRKRAAPLLARAQTHQEAVLRAFGAQDARRLRATLQRLIELHSEA
jgi:DNA-binding MarR family transcriptional regulator